MKDHRTPPGEEQRFASHLAQATHLEQAAARSTERNTARRSFLKWTGLAAAAFVVGCEDSPVGIGPGRGGPGARPDNPGGGDSQSSTTAGADAVTIDLTTDVGVLNYAYALEQLEAAFYIHVVDNFYSGGKREERDVFEDLRAHEIVHRDFFKAALGAAAIPDLAFDFSAVNFRARGRVLQLAETFEDVGVSAYNGAAPLLNDVDLLAIAGKIVSVEARHASAIASLRRPNGESFAPQAFGLARDPSEVLQLISPFVVTEINAILPS